MEDGRARFWAVKKAVNDGRRLKERACAVLVLNENGQIIEEITREPRDHESIRLVAVLAPALVQGVIVPEALVLEVGFSRAHPYAKASRKSDGKRHGIFTERTRVRELSTEEYSNIHIRLLELMRELTLKLREAWTHKEPWRVGRKNVEFARGIFFSIDKSDMVVYAHMLAEDVRSRQKSYFRNMARRIERLIAKYNKAYSDKQFRKLMGADQLAFLLGKQKEPALYVREILKHVRPPYRIGLQRVVDLFRIPFDNEDAESRLVDEYARSHPPVEGLILLEVRRRKRLVHGKNCFVLEACLDKYYCKAHEVQF